MEDLEKHLETVKFYREYVFLDLGKNQPKYK